MSSARTNMAQEMKALWEAKMKKIYREQSELMSDIEKACAAFDLNLTDFIIAKVDGVYYYTLHYSAYIRKLKEANLVTDVLTDMQPIDQSGNRLKVTCIFKRPDLPDYTYSMIFDFSELAQSENVSESSDELSNKKLDIKKKEPKKTYKDWGKLSVMAIKTVIRNGIKLAFPDFFLRFAFLDITKPPMASDLEHGKDYSKKNHSPQNTQNIKASTTGYMSYAKPLATSSDSTKSFQANAEEKEYPNEKPFKEKARRMLIALRDNHKINPQEFNEAVKEFIKINGDITDDKMLLSCLAYLESKFGIGQEERLS